MKKVGLVCCLGMLFVCSLSCGHPRALTSMYITPASSTVLGIGDIIPVQYKAYGTFIHPAETLDISQQVTWESTVPQVATVDNGITGGRVVPAGQACGSTIIRAIAGKNLVGGNGSSGSLMIAEATFIVADPTVPGCPTQ